MKILVLILCLITFEANAVTVRGIRSCGIWLQSSKQRNTAVFVAAEAWLLGYLSGVSATSNKDVLKYVDNASISVWMDNYCQAHPLDDIADGAEALFKEVMQKRGL